MKIIELLKHEDMICLYPNSDIILASYLSILLRNLMK